MTTMSTAFEAAGVSKADMELYASIVKFFKSDGTLERSIALCKQAAAAMPGEGHVQTAQQGQRIGADARQPIAGGEDQSCGARMGEVGLVAPAREPLQGDGHLAVVQQDHANRAVALKPIASGSGQLPRAQQGQRFAAPPAREPTPGFIRATIDAHRSAARSLLDLRHTSDGRLWGDVKPREFVGMKRDAKYAATFERFLGQLNTTQAGLPLRDLLTAEQVEMAFAQAERSNDD